MSMINKIDGGVKLQYDSKKSVPGTTLEKIETLFDTNKISQIHIKIGAKVYIISEKHGGSNDGSLKIRDNNGNLIEDKTVQDILGELDAKKLEDILDAYSKKTESALKYNKIFILEDLDIGDITEEKINQFNAIERPLSCAEDDFKVANYRGVKKYFAALEKALEPASQKIKGISEDRIGPIRKRLAEIEDKKQGFIDHIPDLTVDEITNIANAFTTTFSQLITINGQNYECGEIMLYLNDPEIMAMVVIQTAKIKPALLTTDKTIFKQINHGFNVLSDKLVAISESLPTNQRIISFKEKVGEKEETRYMLVERQSNGTYTIITAADCKDYDEYSVKLDGDQLEVKTKDNGTVDEVDLVVDHQWHRFKDMGLNGNGYEVYQEMWEDGEITRKEAKTLGLSQAFYNWASSRGMFINSEGDESINWDDLNGVFERHIDQVSYGASAEYRAYVIRTYAHTNKIIAADSKKVAKKWMGDKTTISGKDVIAKVDSGSQTTAKKILEEITGKAYEDKVLINLEQLIIFIERMLFLKLIPANLAGQDDSPFKEYPVTRSEVEKLYLDADDVIAWLKGEAVGGGFDKKEAKTERAKDYTRDYNGKSAQELIEAKQALKKQLVEARIKLQKSINQLKPFIRMDPGTNRPIGKADGTFELTTTTPGLEKANKEVKELRGSTEELQGRIYTVEELLKKANTGDPVLQAQLDIDNENYDKVINNDSLPAYIKAYAALKKANKVLQDEMMSLSLSEKYSSTLERATEKNRAAIEDRIGEEAVQKTKPEREQLIAQAETLISPYFTGDSTLKDSVDSKEQAMVLYIYSQYIIQEAGTDKEKLSDANAKYLTLLRKAKAHLEGLNNYYPLYQTIKTDAERIELLYPDIIDGQLEFQISMGEGIPSRVYTTLDKYISSLEAEITGLETKPTLSAEEKDKLRGYYERLFSLYQAKAEYNKCLELGKKIIDAMESEKIKKESVEDEDGGKSRKGLSQWKEVTKSIKKNLRNRKKILPVKLEDLMSTFYEAEYGKSSADKKNAKQQAIYKTLELITLMKGANNLTPLNKKACSLSPTMTRNEKTKDWPDPKDRFKTFEDAQNYLDDLYKKTIKE